MCYRLLNTFSLVQHVRRFSIDKSSKNKNVHHPKLLFKKKSEKSTFNKTTVGLGKKGVLRIVFLIGYMFNDISPIYNVLKIQMKIIQSSITNPLLLSGIAKKIKLISEATTNICVYHIRFGFLLSK